MVRLKLISNKKSRLLLGCLNSTMVRLKRLKLDLTSLKIILSQFHYGSIKTFIIRLNSDLKYGLNSTMVRLKLKQHILNTYKKICLNSTMVRLKHDYDPNIVYSISESQFHYGSIKTIYRAIEVVKNITSQFHYGSIKTVNKTCRLFYFYFVSIPLWFD